MQTPGGYKFWVGVTHQKSKLTDFTREAEAELRARLAGEPGGLIEERVKAARDAAGKRAAEWRNREARRTHEIMKELAAGGRSDDVLLLGDMNDEPGRDAYEELAGGDAVALLVGPQADGFALLTRPLADRKEISYGGYARPEYRSLIDHAVATPAMKDQIVDVRVYQDGLARVASDHYPLVVKLRSDPAGDPPDSAAVKKPAGEEHRKRE